MCGIQESLSSTVIPSKRDLLTHSIGNSVDVNWRNWPHCAGFTNKNCLAFLRMWGKAI